VKNIERRTGQALGILSGLPVTLLIGVVPVHAQSTPVTACGQVLSAPGRYHLTADLGPCTGHGVVITASRVHLTLAGFTLSGIAHTNDCDFAQGKVGILVVSPGPGLSSVRVNGGTVTGFFNGIILEASSSRVNAMTVADSCLGGIGVFGTGDIIDTNVVTTSGYAGIFLGSSNNVTVLSNDISGNPSCGLFINDSHDNTIRSNIVKNNGRGICADRETTTSSKATTPAETWRASPSRARGPSSGTTRPTGTRTWGSRSSPGPRHTPSPATPRAAMAWPTSST